MLRTIAIKLIPKASSDRIGEMRKLPSGDEQLVVYVKAAPDKGKANDAMLRLLAKHFHVAVSRVRIVRGHTGRNKLAVIEDS